jgi:hypothetical protein
MNELNYSINGFDHCELYVSNGYHIAIGKEHENWSPY